MDFRWRAFSFPFILTAITKSFGSLPVSSDARGIFPESRIAKLSFYGDTRFSVCNLSSRVSQPFALAGRLSMALFKSQDFPVLAET